jgi:hypothetical protein
LSKLCRFIASKVKVRRAAWQSVAGHPSKK